MCLVAGLAAACDHGLVPPDEPPVGTIRAIITYAGHPDAWPPRDSLHDLRFVAMRFVPEDTTDFLQLNRLVFSERLRYHVPVDTVVLENIETGLFPYSGVAQRYAADLFAWRPVGLYDANGGILQVRPGETADVRVLVDFRNPPPFPPPAR